MPEYFTLAEFRELPDMSDEGQYTDARIEAVAAALVVVVERAVGTSFVPRTYTKTLSEVGGDVVFTTPYVLETVSVVGSDPVWTGFCIGSATRSVSVTYTAGYSEEPPADIKEALMWAVRDRLLETDSNAGIDARRTSQITPEGTINYVLPGPDRPSGYPQLDAAIMGWHKRLFGLGFA